MSSCPNCLANNSIKKVYRDGSVFEICEYCNTTTEVTKRTAREENEVQNDVEKEESSGMGAFAIVAGAIIFMIIIDIIY